MKPTQKLHQAGQSLWLDNITRELLTTGALRSYIDDLGITGLTSNPTIFDHAFSSSDAYDDAIREAAEEGLAPEDVFFRLAIEDLQGAADLFRPVWDRTNGIDGWVSLEVSPRLARDPGSTLAAAVDRLWATAGRPNLFIKIPGTPEGLDAIEEAIFAGVPVNVTLLFSREQYLAAAERPHARRRAPGRGRARCGGGVGRVGVRQPLGHLAGGEGAAGARAERARHRPGEAQLRRLPRAARLAPLGAAGQRGGAAAAAAVGEHGHQGPGGLGRPLRPRAGGAPDRQHDAREDPSGLRRPRRGVRLPARRRGRRPAW